TRDLERQSMLMTAFGQIMRSRLGGASLVSISKDPLDRIVRLTFRSDGPIFRRLVIQLTGRSADLFLLDEMNRIIAVLREQAQTRLHEVYQPPPSPQKERGEELNIDPDQLDAHFAAIDAARVFDSRAKGLRTRLTKTIRQQRTLKARLHEDLARHGDPETHKRTGDLLLANIATAVRDRNKVRITDYYTDGAPVVEIEIDENRSLQDEAAARFRQYTKAKHAAAEIAERLQQVDRETAALERRLQQLDEIIRPRDEAPLNSFEKPAPAPKVSARKASKPEKIPGVRRYLSTDGYEILVGRA